ncbi:MAG: hypothetical protein V3S89_08620 [Desulfobacterales bacterium]
MWKSNWDETKQHFIDWWQHDGLVLGAWGAPGSDGAVHEETTPLPRPESIREHYSNGELRAKRNHRRLARQAFPADVLPVSDTHIGAGDLGLLLGCEPGFSEETVWFRPVFHQEPAPEKLPPLVFDDTNPWWQVIERTLKASADLAQGKYMVGCPDLVENIDILSALREGQTLMRDMIDRPEWVERKVQEINRVWFEAYQRIYDIIRLDDGSSAFGAFRIWGPGRTAKLQCDASAMFSPTMFERFVTPSLTQQCAWLDHSIYHLDGTQAICHLDNLLNIAPLDAIEWTPQAGIENGGHSRWYGLYRQILSAGKSVQVVGVAIDEIIPLLDAIGSKGIYILTGFASAEEAKEIVSMVETYR